MIRGCSRAWPIIWAIATWHCRSARAGCATATIMYWMKWRKALARSSRSRRRHSSLRRAHTTARAGTAINPRALLRLCHLVSAALPIGAYAYSQGLEFAVEAGWVHDEASALDWLQGLSSHSVGTLDLPILARLHRAWCLDDTAMLAYWNAQLLAARET